MKVKEQLALLNSVSTDFVKSEDYAIESVGNLVKEILQNSEGETTSVRVREVKENLKDTVREIKQLLSQLRQKI